MGSFLLPLVKDALRFLLHAKRLSWSDGRWSYPDGCGRGGRRRMLRGCSIREVVITVANSTAREVTGMLDLVFLIPGQWCCTIC